VGKATRFVVRTVRRILVQVRVCAVALLLGVAATASGQYGGPYEIDAKEKADKIAEFDAIRSLSINWDSSKAEVLDRKLFIDSIKENRSSNTPKADEYQRYNYVIENGEIRVAVWLIKGTVRNVCRRAPPILGIPYLGARIKKGVMVNFFPEDTRLPDSSKIVGPIPKTCESTTPSGKTTGVLDGHSKHFMLAQGMGTKLSKYKSNPSSGEKWAATMVDYAGEIIVNVRDCYYIINQGSGTYKPRGGTGHDFVYLLKVATLFATTVGTPPVAVWDTTMSVIPTTTNPVLGMPPLECK
jgi:hypothetical protein